MNIVLEILLSIINNPSQSGINYDIAITVLENLNKIEDININELAKLCYVSPATISRFCKYIGCNGFADFKEILSRPSIFTNKPTPFKSNQDYDNPNLLLKSIFHELNTLNKYLDLSKIDKLIKDLYNYKKVYIFGRGNSGHYAKELQYNLAFYNKITFTFNNLYDQIDYFSNADKDTLIIIFTVSGQYLFPYKFDDVLREKQLSLNNTNAKVICITKNPNIIKVPYVNDIIQFGVIESNNLYNYSLTFIVDLISLKYSKYVSLNN